jgi:diguanylate cyclase (GGDEF)-like protein
MLLAQGLTMLFFATGFVSYYSRAWQYAARQKASDWRRGAWIRLAIPAAGILVSFLLAWTGSGHLLPVGGLVQQGIALFIVSYIALDAHTTTPEYILRSLALAFFWAFTHRAVNLWPNSLFSFLLLIVWLTYVRANGKHIRYHLLQHSLVLMTLAALYWLTIDSVSAGFNMNPTLRIQALLLYACSSFSTGLYLFELRQSDKQSEANARRATYDALTNTKTYAIFQDDLEQQFAASIANAEALTMVEIDVDHFKQVNDHYGHLAGNEILIGVATTLRDVLRRHPGAPQLYRTGGEEFSLIFAGQTTQEVMPVLIDCWRTVRRTRYSAGDNELAVTISCGGTERTIADNSADDLFKRVDDNMYQSKKRGRDVITMNGDTLRDNTVHRAREILAYYTQTMVDLQDANKLVAHEVVIARNLSEYDRWQTWPFGTPLTSQLAFMNKAVNMAPELCLAISLSKNECIEPYTVRQLHDFMQSHAGLHGMMVQIKAPVSTELLRQVQINMAAEDIKVVISVDNLDAGVIPMTALHLIDSIKLSMGMVRKALGQPQSAAVLRQLVADCSAADVTIICTDVNSPSDAEFAQATLHARYAQGYYYDRPDLPRID